MRACPKCGGSGVVHNPKAQGAEMARQRTHAGLTLREVARRMNFTVAYICDLENGRRAWNHRLQVAYFRALSPRKNK